jgi:hypothetical protein
MKENAEVQRVNYSLQKHHRELLHKQINPRVIETIELAENPSLNYRKAFESVYHNEMEEQVGREGVRLPKIGHSSSHQSLQNRSYKPNFTDFDEERHRKFDDLINRGLEGGLFFRAQDDYQRRKQVEKSLASNTLKQQLVINREMRTMSKQKENQEAEVLRVNRARQL